MLLFRGNGVIIMTATNLHVDLTPWKPTPTDIPVEWKNLIDDLACQAKGTPYEYVLKVKYDAQGVGDLLRSWGLPLPVVMAGYLMEYDKKHIQSSGLEGTDQILQHMNEAYQFTRDIEDENLPPLLTPPYQDLGALLIAVAIYYQALQVLQERSKDQPYTKTLQSNIEHVGRTLLNIAKRLGMWHFKREIEDLIEQLRSPAKFAETKREYTRILEQDSIMLEDTCQLFTDAYTEATQQNILVRYTPCGIAGLKRRIQDANTVATSQKTQLTGFDLVTFDVIVPSLRDCYTAFGVLNQLGNIQYMTDQIANPKPNGYSRLTLDLNLQAQNFYTRRLKWSETHAHLCNIQIATHLMHTLTWYGCLYPSYYQLHTKTTEKEKIELPTLTQLWNSEEGKAFLTI